MGSICSKGSSDTEKLDEYDREKELNKSSVNSVAPASSKRGEFVVDVVGGGGLDGSLRPIARTTSQASSGFLIAASNEEKKSMVVEKPTNGHHQRRATTDMGSSRGHPEMSRIGSTPRGAKGEKDLAGWPSWLTSVAGDAIKGLVPRRAESFEKLDKVSSNFSWFFLFSLLQLWPF